MEIIAVVAALLLGSAILGTLLANNRTLGRMDTKLKILCMNDADKETRIRTLEHPPVGQWSSPRTGSPPT